MKIYIVASNSITIVGGETTLVHNLVNANKMLGNEVYIINPGRPCDRFHDVPVINVESKLYPEVTLIHSIYVQAERILKSRPFLFLLLFPFYLNRYTSAITQKLMILPNDCIYHGVGQFATYSLKKAKKQYVTNCVSTAHLHYKYLYDKMGVPWFISKRIVDTIKKMELEGFSNAKFVITEGLDVIQYLKNMGINKIIELPFPVEPIYFKKISKKNALNKIGFSTDLPVVAFVGRIEFDKGLHLLIDAISDVYKKGKKVKLLVAGDGSNRQKCQDQAKKLGIESTFLGFRRDVWNVYHAADVVVFPFLSGGGPGLVVIEALAAGIPVIVSYPKKVFADESIFLTFPVGNSKILAEQLLKILFDEKQKTEIGAKGELYANTFRTMDYFSKKIGEIYNW